MIKNILTILLLILYSIVSSQNVSFVLLNAPTKPVFLAGNFNQWKPRDSAFIFKPDSLGQAFVNVTDIHGQIVFKLCLGNWQSVEVKKNGEDISNRTITIYRDTIVYITVEGWKNEFSTPCTSTAVRVKIINDTTLLFNNAKRIIRVYLPAEYFKSDKKYPVFYMHDGQNLFDKCTSFSGEWGIDETLDSLQNAGVNIPIVVGIDNGGTERLNEYSPWINPEFGGGNGEYFCEFIIKIIKPYVDKNFRTHPEREYTLIGGSSMGAYISVYASLKYPEIFSQVLAFSPAFTFSDSIYGFADSISTNLKTKFYFIAGSNEHPTMVFNIKKMEQTLQKSGITPSDIFIKVYNEGEHKEWFWQREFSNAYLWFINH